MNVFYEFHVRVFQHNTPVWQNKIRLMYLYVRYTGGFFGKVSSVWFRTVLMWQLKREFPASWRTRRCSGRLRWMFKICHGTCCQFLCHSNGWVESFLISSWDRLHLDTRETFTVSIISTGINILSSREISCILVNKYTLHRYILLKYMFGNCVTCTITLWVVVDLKTHQLYLFFFFFGFYLF